MVCIFSLFLLVQSFYIQSHQPLRSTRYSVTNNNTIRIIFSIPARQYPVILVVSTKTKDLVRIRGGKVYGILQSFSRNNFWMRRFLSLKLVSLNSIRYIISVNVSFQAKKSSSQRWSSYLRDFTMRRFCLYLCSVCNICCTVRGICCKFVHAHGKFESIKIAAMYIICTNVRNISTLFDI